MENSVETAWEQYKLTFQDSQYMQRLNLKQRREDFEAGFEALRSAQKEINRVEIINHTQTDKEIGRLFVYRGDVELSFQDDFNTLKIFI